MKEFIELVLKNLKSNGFPDKKVSFPMEKMYELADDRGLSFNKVREELATNNAIITEIDDEKIVFSQEKSSSLGDMAEKMKSMFGNIDLGSMGDIMKQVQNMSPEQRSQIMGMYQNMSEEDKKKIMEQANKFGLKF